MKDFPIRHDKIIVRMPNWLGDAVMATPVLADLRRHWADSHITAMCQSNVAPLLKYDPNVDEILSFRRVSGWIHHLHRGEIIDALSLGKYDLGILLTNSFSSAAFMWRGGVKYRVGYTGHWRRWLLSQAIPYPPNIEKQHLVTTYKMLLEPFGICLSDTSPKLYVTQEEREAAKALLRNCKADPAKHILVGINPGAAYGTAKCWLPERFTAVTKRLLEDPRIFVIYFGDPGSASLINQICNGIRERVINLSGKTTLRELIALIQVCNVFLTNDSGPMHIAAALKTPLVAIFGSTSDVKTGPYGIGKVIHKHVECSPCYKRVCPIDFRCMKQIEVEEVYTEIKALIDQIR